jgi:hypothetical protein
LRIGAASLAVIINLAVLANARPAKLFPANRDSVPTENRLAAGLHRYNDRREIENDAQIGRLVPIPCSPKVPNSRRYALPDTVAFYRDLDAAFTANARRGLVVDSAIRSRDDQRSLRKRNRAATNVDGERASSHERGTTFDLSRRMTRAQYRWLLWRLAYYQGIGRIKVIEERSCIHVFVRPQQELPVLGIESLDLELSESGPASVQSEQPTASSLPESGRQ